MKHTEDIKLEIGGKFLNGDYHKNLKQLTKDLDVLIKSAKSETLHIADIMPRTFSKQSLKDAYIQGYRKRAIMSGLKYDSISELNAKTEFENWYINLYGV